VPPAVAVSEAAPPAPEPLAAPALRERAPPSAVPIPAPPESVSAPPAVFVLVEAAIEMVRATSFIKVTFPLTILLSVSVSLDVSPIVASELTVRLPSVETFVPTVVTASAWGKVIPTNNEATVKRESTLLRKDRRIEQMN
jgi:hypothetical protein